MRVGIISDVHGDLTTLLNTLDRLKYHHNTAHVLCAGDIVGRGPDENAVVEEIRQRSIVSVRGNHDDYVNDISPDNHDYLKNLPIDWEGRFGDRSIFMCHGKPGNNMWGMYRDHLSETYLSMVLSSLQVDVLVTGHTHVPLFMQVPEGILVNPGSLYTFDSSRATSGTYGVLDLSLLSFELYDARATQVQQVAFTNYQNSV
ncbi:YfcE family phosphodiesterase [Phototrophicus methaneseepsis]|uniref:Phosphoesterase n=1 Tax=Phototrophicus methaneseepsis TaxID=2710758 RepID=A0A7S8IF50_9CHLR|nr:YfcE family phosphodiesterase [Phototrophicus methaneseepsis]QPC83217.1 YfcE family phosphodiesterase [Phototrophicus methaneseepsis]